jgi:hypothetical protein
MKRFVVILLVVELFIAYFVPAPTCILRHDQVRAFAAWRDSPTPETKAEWERQKHIPELQSLGFSGVAFGVMAGATLFAAYLWRRQHSSHSDLRDETRMV